MPLTSVGRRKKKTGQFFWDSFICIVKKWEWYVVGQEKQVPHSWQVATLNKQKQSIEAKFNFWKNLDQCCCHKWKRNQSLDGANRDVNTIIGL